MKIKTFTLNHYDEAFELRMANGLDHEFIVSNMCRVNKDHDGALDVYELSAEYLLKTWIGYGLVQDNINLSQVVSFASKGRSNERTEEVTYKKHWFWGWRKDEN